MQEKLSGEFKELVEQAHEDGGHLAFGREVNDAQVPGTEGAYFIFRTRALNLTARACGTDSDHYRQLRNISEAVDGNLTRNFYPCLGILEAAQRDFDAGLLFSIKSLITRAMFVGAIIITTP